MPSDLNETLAGLHKSVDNGYYLTLDVEAMLLSAVENVLAVHQRAEYTNRGYQGRGKPDIEWTVSYCIECGTGLDRDDFVIESWPCPTVKALTDALGGA